MPTLSMPLPSVVLLLPILQIPLSTRVPVPPSHANRATPKRVRPVVVCGTVAVPRAKCATETTSDKDVVTAICVQCFVTFVRGVAHATVTTEHDLLPKASSDEQHKLLPCGRPTPILQGLTGAEVAFTAVNPLQQVTSAVESKKFKW
jgi:hypothetical protein